MRGDATAIEALPGPHRPKIADNWSPHASKNRESGQIHFDFPAIACRDRPRSVGERRPVRLGQRAKCGDVLATEIAIGQPRTHETIAFAERIDLEAVLGPGLELCELAEGCPITDWQHSRERFSGARPKV